MAKSRSEVLASLRAIMGGAEDEAPAKKAKVVHPMPNGSKFGKFRKAPAPVAVVDEDDEDEEEEEFEEDEEEESEVVDSDSNDTEEDTEEEETSEDVEVAPVEELLDRVESLIDYISENSEALKAWIAAVR